jgi:hypothetical protein
MWLQLLKIYYRRILSPSLVQPSPQMMYKQKILGGGHIE